MMKIIAGLTLMTSRTSSLYDDLRGGRLGHVLPAALVEQRLFQVALWQWIGILWLVVLSYLAAVLLGLAIVRILRLLTARFKTAIDHRFFEATIGPVRLGVGLLLFSGGLPFLGLPGPVSRVVTTIEKAGALVSVTWLLLRIIDVLGELATARLIARGHVAAITMVPLGRKTVKVVVFALGFIAVLQNVGLNVTGLLAGLGIGGLAIALAAQKTVENFFGGIALTVDQPVRVGDFCKFGNTMGTVEEIGLRSTRIRTLERTVVSIANAEFSSLQLENFNKRDRIWLRTVIGLRYETTPDQLRYVLVEIRGMLYAHSKVLPDPLWARFIGFGTSSLDVEVFAYVATQNPNEFSAIREDIYLRILEIVAASGTALALPSHTVHVRRDAGCDEEKSKAAEERVRAWRADGQLFIPEFPPEKISALAHTLPYPPEGAASRTA
jgi:MscS family membrane protein